MVELLGMQRVNERGYTPFEDASEHAEEEAALPISIPAQELQRLTANGSPETTSSLVAEARSSVFSTVTRFVWQGGSPGDAWLHMTAAQVSISCMHCIADAFSCHAAPDTFAFSV